jgi:hypothetical protein
MTTFKSKFSSALELKRLETQVQSQSVYNYSLKKGFKASLNPISSLFSAHAAATVLPLTSEQF